MDRVELLAPAGDRDSLDAALRFGADAVYFGGPMLQLRAARAGFRWEDVQKALQTVHAWGKKAYVTVNSFAYNEEIDKAGEYAKRLKDAGADAVIVSDLGVLTEIKRAAPDLAVHISTQANTMNYRTAQVYHDLGASRIVLARELTIEQIAALRAKTPKTLELEAFIHGAMCMSYSGRCILSAFLNARSGNRGECTQPCRWNYYLMEEKRPGQYFPIFEEDGATAILSSHDLKALPLLERLKQAGVTSFKIEGRMKTAYYVGTVVNAYRMALDGTEKTEALEDELSCAPHRPYETGFYEGHVAIRPNNSAEISQSAVFIGIVREVRNGRMRVEQRNRFSEGERAEVLSPGKTGRGFTVSALCDEEGTPIGVANHPQQQVWMDCPCPDVSAGDLLRRRESEKTQ